MEEEMKKIEDIEKEIELLKDQLKNDHAHTGFDFSRVKWINIAGRQIFVHHNVLGADAASSAHYGAFFIAPFRCVVISMTESHEIAGTDGGAVILNLEKLTSGEAPDSGDELLETDLSLKTTKDTPQNGVIINTPSTKTLSIGDRLCLKNTGVMDGLRNLSVIVGLNML